MLCALAHVWHMIWFFRRKQGKIGQKQAKIKHFWNFSISSSTTSGDACDNGFRVHLFPRRRKCRFAEMLVASHFRLKALRLLFRAKATVLREGCGKINGNFENSKLRFEQGALCAPCNFAPLSLLFPQKPRFCGSPFGTQKLSSSTDGQAQRRFGGEAEQYVLDHPRLGGTRATVHRTADTRYFDLRGEPTTKYSGWRCPRRHAITLMAPRSKLPDFNQKWPFLSRKRSFFICFDWFPDRSSISKNLN